MRICNAWNTGGLTSEGVEVTGKWRLWQEKYCMKLVTELECIWWCDCVEARKWKDFAKRIMEKERGRQRLLVVTSGQPRKSICFAIGKTKHPHARTLPPFPFTHTWLNAGPLIPGFQHTATTLALFLSFNESRSTLADLGWNEAWNVDILFQHTGVYYTVSHNLLHTHWEKRHVLL